MNSNNDSNAHKLYFLSSSENTKNILVTQPLLGIKNYHSWSRAMVLALMQRRRLALWMGRFQCQILIHLCMKIGRVVIPWFFPCWSILCTYMFLAAACTMKQQGRCGLSWRICFHRAMDLRSIICKGKFLISVKIRWLWQSMSLNWSICGINCWTMNHF